MLPYLAHVIVLASLSVAAQPPLDYDVASLLIRSMTAPKSFETTFVAEISPLSIDGQLQLDQEWEQKQTIHSVYAGVRFLQEVDSEYAVPDNPHNVQMRFLWNGTAGFRQLANENGFTIMGKARPADHNHQGFLFDQVAGRYASISNLPEIIQKGKDPEQSVDQGRLTHRFTAGWSDDVTFEIVAQVEPDFLLQSIEMTITREEPLGMINTTTFTIEEWNDYDGVSMPSKARLDARAFNRLGFEGQWISTVTSYVRTSFNNLGENPPDKSFFEVAYEQGMNVFDERLNLSFTVGENLLFYDGAVYETDAPIMEHPGDQLGALIRNAKSAKDIPLVQQTANTNIAGEEPRFAQSAALGIGAAI